MGAGPSESLRTLQALVEAEAAFLDRLGSIMEKHFGPGTNEDIEVRRRNLNHELTFHIARFFFLLKETGCTTEDRMKNFLKTHNHRMREIAENESTHTRDKNFLSKYLIDGTKMGNVIGPISRRNFIVLSETTIGQLLYGHGSITGIAGQVRLLAECGILSRVEPDQFYEQRNASLIRSADGALEDAYQSYLTDIRRGVTGE